jgi:XTP/dITP diphosphohydrolase
LISEFLLATRSQDKAREIREILTGQNVRLRTLDDLSLMPTPAEDDVENGATFLDNAIAKAQYFAIRTGRAALADDSGLMVDALGGQPGVRTKRFARDHGYRGDDVDEANNNLLLRELADVGDTERGAQYVCAAALATPDGTTVSSLGTCRGIIARAHKGDAGFGYDPIFYLPDLQVTFAQLTSAQKHQYSHRARAFRALATHLKSAS